MLREWLGYLTTPCPRHLRRLGYLHQLIGLQSRHRRCHRAWQPHLDNSRAVIGEAAAAAAGDGQAVILGSGLLLDVPLAALAARFREVVLVDLLHLPAARRKARQHGNVRLVEADVTGLSETLAALEQAPARLPRGQPGLPGDLAPDLVVSCNLLSQLPLVPRDHLRERLGYSDEAELVAFCHDIIAAHLDWLSRFQARVCLICDKSRSVLKDGAVVDREDALFGLRLPAADRTWDWDIAPAPEIDRQYGLRHEVVAFSDYRAACQSAARA